MLNFKRVDSDMPVRVAQTTGNPRKPTRARATAKAAASEGAINGFDLIVREMQRRRVEVNKVEADKIENSVLRDAFP
jgi:hypothetical protein